MQGKNELRLILKERRFSLSDEERNTLSEEIAKRLEPLLKQKTSILFYASKLPEVETLSLMDRMLKAGKIISVPIIEKETHTLRLSKIDSIDELKPSTFSVPEPITSEKPISPDSIDTVLLPLLGFDRAGRRLGYGAGYYDRFLAKNSHLLKIGLAYSLQEEWEIPVESTDIRLDYVVTEKELIICQ